MIQNLREYTAMTQSKKGDTQAVTVIAYDKANALDKLMRLGYHAILWIL